MTTATKTYTLGRFVWRELYSRDAAASKRFYSSVFGWTAEDKPMGPDWSYTIWKSGDTQIGGMMDLANLPGGGDQVPPHWSVYVSVADVDQAAALAVAAGGKVVGECHEIPGVGRFAVVQDPQGAHISLFRSSLGDPADVPAAHGEFCWENLSTTDGAAAAAFYQQVVGWTSASMGENQALVFSRTSANGPVGVASVGPVPPGAPANWGPFVSVAAIGPATAKCREFGAKVLLEPTDIPHVGKFSIIQDPCDAVFFLFEAIAG